MASPVTYNSESSDSLRGLYPQPLLRGFGPARRLLFGSERRFSLWRGLRLGRRLARAAARFDSGLLRGRRRGLRAAVAARLAGGGFCRRLFLFAPAAGARVAQPHRLLQRDGVGRHVGRQRGVDAIVADIGAIAAVLDHDRPALVGMIAERAAGVGAEAPLAWPLGLLLLDQGHRAVEPDREHVVAVREVGVGLAVLHVGTEAADAGQDRLAVVGMLADLARQREEAERAGEIDVVGRHALGQAGALGLLALDRLAELQIR